MKNRYFLLGILAISTFSIFAQRGTTFDQQYEPIRNELRNWDPVKGEWLSNSIISVTNQEAVPLRDFQENLTPSQMISTIPASTLDRITSIARSNTSDTEFGGQWSQVVSILDRPNCTVSQGRSYGDPHLESLDGARYSFQTVGEFVLAKSNNGAVEVQTRQKAQSDDFSLNTAVAMNVNGDRVSIYAEDYPDANQSTPVRVNGKAVIVDEYPYALSNGGILRKSRGMYVVDWPTGESAIVELRNGSRMSFMNVSVNVYPCTNGGYSGLMGNGNGFVNDDYNTSRGVAPVRMTGSGPLEENADYIERQRLAYLVKEFAEEHRISQASSLFDYPIGASTITFTDRTFPRVHRTVNDLTMDQRNTARKHCESNGISGEDMNACIYDNAYLGIQPTKRHVVDDPTDGIRVVPATGGGPRDTNPVKDPVKSKGTTIFDAPQPIDPQDEPKIKVKEPVRETESSDPPQPRDINISTPRSNEGTRPSIPQPRTSTPRPSTPKPSAPKPSVPKPSGGTIKGR